MQQKKEWFGEWFDSPYYHILYQNRDYTEAEKFIHKLLDWLKPAAGSRFLDLACGKGRHSQTVNARGYQVTGLDISPESIAAARKNALHNMHFAVHDMREKIPGAPYEYVLNLFTSFGYFETEAEDMAVLHHVYDALVPGGRLVLDFMNPDYVLNHLVSNEEVILDNILFAIKRYERDGRIIKSIAFSDGCAYHRHEESVRIIRKNDFLKMFTRIGFSVETIFADYELNAFNEELSPRMVFVLFKPFPAC